MVLKSISSTTLIIFGDTHAFTFYELSKKVIDAIINADWVIHTGDFISKSVLMGLIGLKGNNFKGVYGNADPLTIRNVLPYKVIFEVFGKKFGIVHPACEGSSKFTERKAISEFRNKDIDVLIYGHTHEYKIAELKNITIINPGKAYTEQTSFGPPSTFVKLTIDKERISDIKLVEI